MACCPSGPPRLPTFNLTCNVWWGLTAIPPPGPPNIAALACQLFPGDFDHGGATIGFMWLRVPALSDLHWNRVGPPAGPDLVECPAGSLHYYTLVYVNDVGKGFPNEYRFARMQDTASPIPIP